MPRTAGPQRFYSGGTGHATPGTSCSNTVLGALDHQWLPGEAIPAYATDQDLKDLKTDIHDMISTMQASISSQLSAIAANMGQLEERVLGLEGSIEELPIHQPSPMTTPTSSTREERKRRTPLQIQVFISTLTYYCD